MEEIRLQKGKWFYDPTKPLGPAGGFGEVFAGESPEGNKVAIKRLHIGSDASAHRELRVASLFEGQDTSYIIPMYDSGEDANSGRYFVVMALAERSLQTEIAGGRKFSAAETVDILKQIAAGISELNGLVHRDLKPGNILLHEGKWKIGDFGIARFVEESTSLQTLKGCLSPQYAAPEQWQLEPAGTPTDLYALGCIAFQLLSGSLPFHGPRMEDFHSQHLKEPMPDLPNQVPPILRTVVGMLLRKGRDARPSLGRLKELLVKVDADAARAQTTSPIAEAAARLERQRAEEESASAQLRAKEQEREILAESGRVILVQVVSHLRERILADAPSCMYDDTSGARLGQAQISLSKSFRGLKCLEENSFPQSKIDVVLAHNFRVVQFEPRYAWESALLYCRMPKSKDYRWYEVSFMPSPLTNNPRPAPFSLLDNANNVRYTYRHPDLALSNTMHSFQVAFGPKPIDDEDEEEFLERWTTVFAVAAEGKLRNPMRMPLDPKYWKNLGIYGI